MVEVSQFQAAPGHGLVIIPDISGFTQFVSQVELHHGGHIVADLLETLIGQTRPWLSLSEIEGDALLYHHLGPPPPLAEVVAQMRAWYLAFHERLNLLRRDVYCPCGVCQNLGNLHLKAVAHFGELAVRRVGSQEKLFGLGAIVAHRLLKNSAACAEYLLFSRELIDTAEADPDQRPSALQWGEESYEVLGQVPVAYLDLATWRSDVAPAPATSPEDPQTHAVEAHTHIRADLPRVVAVLGNLKLQTEWMVGVSEMRVDTTRPLQRGTHHVCVLDGMEMHQTLETVERNKEDFRMSVRIKPPAMLLRGWSTTFEARREGDRVRVAFRAAYTPRWLTGWLFGVFMAPRLRTTLRASLDRLKARLEAGELA